MAKIKVSQWDSVAANNTDINSININEGCPPSTINNAIREVMAQIKNWQDGSSGDSWTSTGALNITGALALDGNLGFAGQVIESRGSTDTPIWKSLGTMSLQNNTTVNITGGSITTTGTLDVTGALRLDGSVGTSGQVLKSVGSTQTPTWTTLGNMSSQDNNAVNITGGSVNVTGALKLDGSTGSSGQVLKSVGSTETPVWTTLGTMSNENSNNVNITGGSVNVTGSLKLDGSVGSNGQVLKSVGSTSTPVWTTLGTMSTQNSNAVNITGGSVKTTSDLNVTGALKLNNSVGSSGQYLVSSGSSATPTWKSLILGTMANQNSNAVNITGGTITGTTINGHTVGSNSTGNKFVSTANPSGGADGDIWYKI